jgi:hypothetical protein
MSEVMMGGCLCGSVRYQCEGELGPAAYCHCVDCRKCTDSAFNIGVRIEARQFQIVRGSPRAFTKSGESGTPLTRHFCPDCGSPCIKPRLPIRMFCTSKREALMSLESSTRRIRSG